MFLGTYTPKLDEKGRFFLPAKFRDELAEGLVITRSQDRCLAIYPMATFVTMTQPVSTAPATLKQVRDYQRMLAAGASDEIPDKQGRVTIPPMLRAYAALDKDIVVAGAINRVEVWDAAGWQAYSAAQEDAFAAMNEEILTNDAGR
ncbi:MraZ protein [Propionibacterium cyclohexanicum]|uniref:Transcriptional regulator MraZ n=1 Tax=Propionibacterium cyclohexanicum TaxID=64702 RepID=A0A1H9PJD5_9ACTN|nr:division/cell wall cluster transcriptional repressor MraZ [Propionibacterium cyclohexanicum]SER48200.1 MraZ protein [Propionibacterium cyclohexanicum]